MVLGWMLEERKMGFGWMTGEAGRVELDWLLTIWYSSILQEYFLPFSPIFFLLNSDTSGPFPSSFGIQKYPLVCSGSLQSISGSCYSGMTAGQRVLSFLTLILLHHQGDGKSIQYLCRRGLSSICYIFQKDVFWDRFPHFHIWKTCCIYCRQVCCECTGSFPS